MLVEGAYERRKVVFSDEEVEEDEDESDDGVGDDENDDEDESEIDGEDGRVEEFGGSSGSMEKTQFSKYGDSGMLAGSSG